MKAVAFNGSPRKGGNTEQMIRFVLARLEAAGIETEYVRIGGRPFHGCTACCKCRETKDNRCSIDNDPFNDCLQKMLEADCIIIGSPTYVADVTSETKALLDRTAYVVRANGNPLMRKVGVALSAVRRAGSIHALDTINHLFSVLGLYTVGSSYWNLCIGKDPGEVMDDPEGMRTLQDLADNTAWLLKKIHVADA